MVTLADDLVGLHATDPATIYLTARARLRRPQRAIADLERALYDDRSLVRTLGMRRTMFVVPVGLVPIVQAACTESLVPRERRRFVDMVEAAGITDDGAGLLRWAEDRTLEALERTGGLTGAELSSAVPELRQQMLFGEGTAWAGTTGISTRVLFLLSTEQKVVRGRPRGSWTSSQYKWSLMRDWVPGGMPTMAGPEARRVLATRWLRTYGPATMDDLRWWTGWARIHARTALAGIGAQPVELAEGPGWVLADDEDEVGAPAPWVALLPALDPATMGWKARSWYLGAHGPQLFDRNGNAGPTVWVDGRVVGGWTQRADGEVVHRLLEDVGREATGQVEAAAGELTAWLGDARVKPRFPTPLQRELSR